MNRALVTLFAKAPEPGKVKSRLAATVGKATALAFYTETVRSLADALSTQEWDFEVAVTPDGAVAAPFFQTLPGNARPQGDGDLGARLARVLGRAAPGRPAIVVGSDVPGITPNHIREAITALATHDLAVGPSPDGGYWLIGAARPPPGSLFAKVRWSTPHARADTLAGASGLSTASLTSLEDVDDEAAYRRWLARRG